MKAVFDTNILIDYLVGREGARSELDQYSKPIVSVVTWMEILIGAKSPEEDKALRHFLEGFTIKLIDINLASVAVELRKQYRIKLPDAIIWATAKVEECLLVTRDVKAFDSEAVDIRVPYELT